MYIFCSYKNKGEKDRVREIFEELQKNDCIKSDRILKSQIGLSNFVSQPAFNTIMYDPLLSNLSKDSIRFFLLHEEGHHIKGFEGYYLKTILWICGVLLMGLTIILSICAFFFGIRLSEWLALATLFLFGAFLTLFSTSISANSLKWGEYDSDKFAAELLRDKYSIVNPSESLKTAFYEYGEFSNRKFKKDYSCVKKIWRARNDYYPTNPQRVDYVKYYIDSK